MSPVEDEEEKWVRRVTSARGGECEQRGPSGAQQDSCLTVETFTKERSLVLIKMSQSPFLRTRATHLPFLTLDRGLLLV